MDSPGSTGHAKQSNFELLEFLEIDDWAEEELEDPPLVVSGYPQKPVYAASEAAGAVGSSCHHEGLNRSGGYVSVPGDSTSAGEKQETKEKVAFRTESEVEVLEDGFKWRKYGKKMVKSSPNPRNYYKCSADGCPVKKRVERDREDPRYVITTYEGVHNHQGPSKF